MKENLKDILSHLKSEVDQETLLAYLQGKLSAAQQHEVEKNLIDGEFDAEALEGLQTFGDTKKLASLVDGLNADLKKKTAKTKQARNLRNVAVPSWLWLAVVLILVIAVIGFIVIKKAKGQ